LCHNGIDLDRFRPLAGPRPLALGDSPFVIGVVCALRPEKGLATLLEAFAEIRHLRPGMRLAIVGSGPALPDLKSMAHALSISESCVFEPATPSVPGWLGAMDIFVLPSLTEALSNSLMEAMACGCCAVASRVGGNPELVKDGETGLLFERQNAEGLATILAKLVQNESLRARLADNGLKFIRENFSLAQSARRMGEIYRGLLAARPDLTPAGE
jgi:glycosyltransferase involved in cell wall biosynthesis